MLYFKNTVIFIVVSIKLCEYPLVWICTCLDAYLFHDRNQIKQENG